MTDLIKNLWLGNLPLWKTFWLYYRVPSIILNLLIPIVVTTAIYPVLGFLFCIVAFAYGAFMWVSVWRSSDKYAGRRVWNYAAKAMIVFDVLSVFVALVKVIL